MMKSRFRSSFPKEIRRNKFEKKKYKVAADNWRMETWRHTLGMWAMVAIMIENWFKPGEDRLDDGLLEQMVC